MRLLKCDVCHEVMKDWIEWSDLGELPSSELPNLSGLKEICMKCMQKIDKFVEQLINEADNVRK